MREYLRPWKLLSFASGVGAADRGRLLLRGSGLGRSDHPDHGVSRLPDGSLVGAVMLERRWKLWPAMVFATWFTVDGCYWLYWRAVDPVALELMRDANWPASLSLYGMCGVIWLYQGSLAELAANLKQVVRRDRTTV